MSDYLDSGNEELLKDFFSEAQSQVELLEQNILVLENDPANRDAVDEIFRAAHTLKGGAATVEMHELTEFTHLVEDVLDEIRSDKISVSEPLVDVLLRAIDVVKAMLDERSVGRLYKKDITALKNDLASFLGEKARVEAGKKASARTESGPVAREQSETSDSGLSEYELLEIREAAGRNRHVFRVAVAFDPDNVMKTVGAIHVFAALRDTGTVLKTRPDFEKLYEDTFWPVVEYYIATDRAVEYVSRRAIISEVSLSVDISEISFDDSGHAASSPSSAPVQESKPKTGKPAPESSPGRVSEAEIAAAMAAASREKEAKTREQAAVHKAAPARAPAQAAPEAAGNPEADAGEDKAVESRRSTQSGGSILRVDSRRIDNLLNLVSETVITKATFNQISTQFAELQSTFGNVQIEFRDSLKDLFDDLPDYLEAIRNGRAVKDVKKEILEKYGTLYTAFDEFETVFKGNAAKFRSTAQNLGRITGELQEGVMRIRMVPISQIFSRFPRLIRDLSRNLTKKVSLVIEGEETELDKSVIEDLLDPLMHSVRNALDHGIESPEERLAAGKPEEGTVLLKASNEGNMIIIEIGDDGKGIDVDAVKKKAIERSLIHPNKALTELEAFNLIFEPGFSTADKVTNISGRGVGLDVVKRQIEKLNGSVTVSSQRGKGTRFIIKLPLTLAIIQGLLVRVGREIYSLPITSVIESHRIKPNEIKLIDGYEVFNVRNDVVSLLRLNRLFRIQTEDQRDYHFVVIVGTNEKRVGLIVDSLIGEEDVVIKPLRDQFTNSPGIAGASILGDGSVCLIIDVSQLLELGLKREIEERTKLEMTIR
ncbi:MAG: chemotaxis protein CheA [Spirochaetes bacterium]|nr:chemotaxis protein CheA [Spirochaetota bacterium]